MAKSHRKTQPEPGQPVNFVLESDGIAVLRALHTLLTDVLGVEGVGVDLGPRDVPPDPQKPFRAVGVYRGATYAVQYLPDPIHALRALAQGVLDHAAPCLCGRPIALFAPYEDRCKWQPDIATATLFGDCGARQDQLKREGDASSS